MESFRRSARGSQFKQAVRDFEEWYGRGPDKSAGYRQILKALRGAEICEPHEPRLVGLQSDRELEALAAVSRGRAADYRAKRHEVRTAATRGPRSSQPRIPYEVGSTRHDVQRRGHLILPPAPGRLLFSLEGSSRISCLGPARGSRRQACLICRTESGRVPFAGYPRNLGSANRVYAV